MKKSIIKYIKCSFLCLLCTLSSCSKKIIEPEPTPEIPLNREEYKFVRAENHDPYPQPQIEEVKPIIIEEHDPYILLSQMGEFEPQLIDLFEFHAILLNDAIEAAVNDASDIMEYDHSNLFKNAHEIAKLLAVVYGSHTANRFEDLFKQHIQLGSLYIQTVKASTFTLAHQISIQALMNGDMLVEFLNIINPFFAHEPERLMFEEHVTIEFQQIMAYFRGDYERAQELKEQSIEQAKEMAEHLIKAIKRQLTSQLDNCNYEFDQANWPEMS